MFGLTALVIYCKNKKQKNNKNNVVHHTLINADVIKKWKWEKIGFNLITLIWLFL